MQGVIYKLTNKANGKMYIGQTINLKARLRSHKNAAFNEYSSNHHLRISKAIAEFGIDAFECEVIWKSDVYDSKAELKEVLNKKEIEYIAQYNSTITGYNVSLGGAGFLGNVGEKNAMYGVHMSGEKSYMFGRHLSDDTKRKISLSKIGKKGTPMSEEHKEKLRKLFTGVPKSEEHKEKIRNASIGQKHPERRKPVLQYDKNGNFIKEWDCAFDAEKIYNDRHINDCCRGTRRIAANYQWRFKEDENFPMKIAVYSRSGNKKIAMTDKDGNTLKIYGSIKDAVVELGINRSSLQEVLSGRQKSTKGMYFTYC